MQQGGSKSFPFLFATETPITASDFALDYLKTPYVVNICDFHCGDNHNKVTGSHDTACHLGFV